MKPDSDHLLEVLLLSMILVGSITALALGLQSSTAIHSSGSISYPVEAKIFLQDGFESGDFGKWNGTSSTIGDTATIASTLPYEGVYHALFYTDAAQSSVKYAYCYVELSPAVSQVYARAYFFIADGLPLQKDGERFGLISFQVGGRLQSTLRVCRSGNVDRFDIVGYNGSTTVNRNTDSIYPAEGQWYCLEFYIKVNSISGEYRAWINGKERISITNVNTASYGSGVSRVLVGLTYTANAQYPVIVYCDTAAVGTCYVGLKYTFGVIGSVREAPAISNFYWLFGNQSIAYRAILPSEVTDLSDVALYDGLVVWTRKGSYNATAVKEFAQTGIVISDMVDFCNFLYPSLGGSTEIFKTSTVTYSVDWGNFREGDRVEMRNETGNTNQLMVALESELLAFQKASQNITVIARCDSSRIAYFHMNGIQPNTGFYVLDLDSTTPETEWAGIWHVFPPIKMVKDFPTGEYARWFAKGISHLTYDEVMSELSDWVAEAPAEMNASVIKIGKSVSGRDINATRLGKGSRYIIVDAALHGNERLPTSALLRLLQVVQESFEENGYWKQRLNEVTLIVIPILNPDGYVAGVRDNGNGVDLNRQFPPAGITTEPEAWALRWLFGNFSTFIYINLHEGRHWEPLEYYYSGNWTYCPVDVEGFSKQNCYWTNNDFKALKHWGYYDEEQWIDNPLPIGKVRDIFTRVGSAGQSDVYASQKYNISSYLVESFVWSVDYDGTNHVARQMLWAMDFYVQTVIGMISHFDRLRNDNLLIVTEGNIRSFTMLGVNRLRIQIDTSKLTHPTDGITKIDVGGRPKPLSVFVDGGQKSEGSGWTFHDNTITVIGARNAIEVNW